MGGANEAGVELAKLRVVLYEDGEPVGIKEITDPREAYCQSYNEAGAQFGRTAKPFIPSPSQLAPPTQNVG